MRRFGTLSFEQAVTPAYQLARDGFYVYPELRDSLEIHAAEIDRYKENAAIFRPGGRTPAVGDRLKQANLARTLERMIEAERKAPGDRAAKLRAAHDCFYKGSIADDIAAYHRKHGGFMTKEDLAGFEAPVEPSISVRYRGFEIHSCDVWCQGHVLLQTLKMLEGLDLKALGWNSVRYLHTISEAMNLAFADREAYVGDPKFIDVPITELLSAEYAAKQRARIDAGKAFGRMPDPGLARQEARGRSPREVKSLLRPTRSIAPSPTNTAMPTPKRPPTRCTTRRWSRAWASRRRRAARRGGSSPTIRCSSSRASARASRRTRRSRCATASSPWRGARRAATCNAPPCCRCSSTRPSGA